MISAAMPDDQDRAVAAERPDIIDLAIKWRNDDRVAESSERQALACAPISLVWPKRCATGPATGAVRPGFLSKLRSVLGRVGSTAGSFLARDARARRLAVAKLGLAVAAPDQVGQINRDCPCSAARGSLSAYCLEDLAAQLLARRVKLAEALAASSRRSWRSASNCPFWPASRRAAVERRCISAISAWASVLSAGTAAAISMPLRSRSIGDCGVSSAATRGAVDKAFECGEAARRRGCGRLVERLLFRGDLGVGIGEAARCRPDRAARASVPRALPAMLCWITVSSCADQYVGRGGRCRGGRAAAPEALEAKEAEPGERELRP